MYDHPNGDFKTEPVDNLADLLREPENRLNSATGGAFEDWLMEYRERLSKVIQQETTITASGVESRRRDRSST